MRKIILIVIILNSLATGCITPKDARVLKRATEEWRESNKVLDAYLDGVTGSSFLILRENGKFENTSSGMVGGFQAGSWHYTNDTIYLSYVNSKMDTVNRRKITIDRQKSKLIEGGVELWYTHVWFKENVFK